MPVHLHACTRALGGSGGRSGLRAWCACLRGREFSWRWILGSGCSFLLLLAEDYNLAATDRTTEAQRHRDSLGSNSRRSPALRSLRATGSSARQPLDHDRCRRSGPRISLLARRPWAGPSGPGRQAAHSLLAMQFSEFWMPIRLSKHHFKRGLVTILREFGR